MTMKPDGLTECHACRRPYKIKKNWFQEFVGTEVKKIYLF